MGKKVIVTGACGFIGSHFAKLCVEKGFETIVIDCITYAGDLKRIENIRSDIKFYETDICDRESIDKIFAEEKPDYIVHWAAESHVDRSIIDASPFINTNIKGTQVLLDTAKKYGVEKFVNIATDEVYGELGESGQFYETTPLSPNSPYSVSKTAADMLGNAYYRTYNLPVVTARPSNNYGPFQYPEKLIPVVFLKALNNERIPVYGKGENIREWLFVEDCAAGVMELLINGRIGEAYNIGSGYEKRNIDVVKSILNIMDKTYDLIEFVADRPGHDFRYSLNTEKIENELNWKAQINFENGIENTIKWYYDNLKWAEEKLIYLKEFWKQVYR